MNRYQIAIPPNGDIMQVAADRMENVDGDLKFFQGNTIVGEARYWQAWSLIGQIGDDMPVKTPPPTILPDRPDAGIAYIEQTIDRLTGRS